MTREHKLALILGFSVVLVVGVLISDHFSDATVAQLEDLTDESTIMSVADTRQEPQPIEQTHATASPRNNTIPDEFLIDGEPQAQTTSAIANPSVFTSGREGLLNKLQSAWDKAQTMDLAPAAELDIAGAHPESTLPEPTIVAHAIETNPSRADRSIPTKTHRVMEDESLWAIAQQHYGDGALYGKLAKFNSDRIADDNSIRIGVVLQIPPKHILTGERPAQRNMTASRPVSSSSRTYTVREGDTLGEIAQRQLGSSRRWTEIVKLNDIEDPDVVPVGTKLKLPAASR